MNDVSAFALAQSQFLAYQLTHEFINGPLVRARVTQAVQAAPSPDANLFVGGLLRVLAWGTTLTKLCHPADFQADVVATRAFFEIAVDVILMHFDPSTFPPSRLLAWDDSAKLRAAVRIRDYFQRRGEQPSIEYAAQVTFIPREEARIGALRARHWNGVHPSRWTGRGRSLEQDARDADRHFPEAGLEEFYETRYQQACWNTHGSGMAGFANIPEEHIPAISALAFRECVDFSLVIAEVVLLHLGIWDAATAVAFDDHRRNVLVTAHAAMTEQLVPPPA